MNKYLTKGNLMTNYIKLPLLASLFFVYSCSETISPVDSGLENKVFHFGNGAEPQGLDPLKDIRRTLQGHYWQTLTEYD